VQRRSERPAREVLLASLAELMKVLLSAIMSPDDVPLLFARISLRQQKW
jgi:hypothetical protein